ncbi:hypothetical protein D0T11_11740 [Hymenobacter rubripertinctus]|uniref:Uncharacterized protein n=1 Tax=Hymenobacter rubripertinctus TaxID=2029981 RepID=A0A418QXE2_9BACT|nr:hypothetical protein D0T11_11740 [Hymenobacter rubripertinctus]
MLFRAGLFRWTVTTGWFIQTQGPGKMYPGEVGIVLLLPGQTGGVGCVGPAKLAAAPRIPHFHPQLPDEAVTVSTAPGVMGTATGPNAARSTRAGLPWVREANARWP